MTLKEILIKSKIKNQDEEIVFEGKGVWNLENNSIQYQDKLALLTIFLEDNIMLRETEDSILSYKFKENTKSNFEVFLKDTKQTGFVPMETFAIKKDNHYYEVTYQIEGNNFKHHYQVEWQEI